MVLNKFFLAVLAAVLSFHILVTSESVGKSHFHFKFFVYFLFLPFITLFPLNFILCICSCLVLHRTVMLRHFDISLSCQIMGEWGRKGICCFCKSWTMYMLQMSLAKWMFRGYSWAMYNPHFYSQVKVDDLSWHSTFVLKVSFVFWFILWANIPMSFKWFLLLNNVLRQMT